MIFTRTKNERGKKPAFFLAERNRAVQQNPHFLSCTQDIYRHIMETARIFKMKNEKSFVLTHIDNFIK